MSVLNEIMKLLPVNADTAEKVRDLMDQGGLDYSACSRREFDAAVRNAYDTLQVVHQDMGTGVRPILIGD